MNSRRTANTHNRRIHEKENANNSDERGAMGDGCEPTSEKLEWWKQRWNCDCDSYEKDEMIQAHQKKG